MNELVKLVKVIPEKYGETARILALCGERSGG
jgi:hypothetical protein